MESPAGDNDEGNLPVSKAPDEEEVRLLLVLQVIARV